MDVADMSAETATDSTLTIIPAGKREMSHVIMLAHRIWPQAYKGILTDEQIRNMLERIYTYEALQKETDAGHQFQVAYVGQMPVGYGSAYLDDDVIWLKKLYIDPHFQGQRIGVRLMHATVTPLLPAAEIRLLANPNNIPAHGFYEHLGFSKIGTVPVQMGDFTFTDYIFSMSLV
jgi:ribosomal protein S18 acetylase RimI-like enzyme